MAVIPAGAVEPGLTRTLLTLVAYESEHGYCPSIRELAAILHRPFTTVHGQVARLRQLGLVDYRDRCYRTLHAKVGFVR